MSLAARAWQHQTIQRAAGALAVLAGMALPAIAAGPATAQQLVGAATALAPHRAVYEIELADSRGATTVSDMTGRMVYELTGSTCAGYSQKMRFVTRMTNQEGNASLTDMRSSSWEDAVAKLFRFNSSQYKDTRLEETTDGDAARSGPRGEVRVEISKPSKKAVSLKGGTYFPVQHSIALLAAARKGDQIFTADLFDGSEKGEKVYSTTSFIGKQRPSGYNLQLGKVASADRLNTLPSWPISISYFEVGSERKDAMPSYELAFLYFENGVSRRLFIDYGDFSVRGTLKRLEFLGPTPCKTSP